MTATEQRVLTPTAGRSLRRAMFWVAGAVFALVVAVVSILVAGGQASGTLLDADNPGPEGAKAVVEVLRQQGVDVVVTADLDSTRTAIGNPETTTLFIYDPDAFLSDEKLSTATELAGHTIFADPGFSALDRIAPELAQAGFVDERLAADCDVAAVRKAGTVSGSGSGYRVLDPSDSITACLGSADDVYSLVQLEQGDRTLTVLGTTGALTNQSVVDDGNAALALNLLGGTDTLVWYLPTFVDLADSPATPGDLTAPWLTPVLALLVLTVIAAAVWRGRRLGPLVIENLPVTVRSSETMLGRARLYERSSSRLRALDALRIGTVQRLATLCGLPRTATVDEVVASVAAVTGSQLGDIRHLLVDAVPASDAQLVSFSDSLLVLERTVATAVRP